MGGKQQPFLIDTGACISIITSAPPADIKHTEVHVMTADGKPIHIQGVCRFIFKLGKITVTHDFLVAPSSTANVLGMDIMKPLDCIVNIALQKMFVKDGFVKLYDNAALENMNMRDLRALHTTPKDDVQTSMCDLSSVPDEFKQLASDQVHKFRNLFREKPLGHCRNYPHVIELTDERPIKQPPRRVSFAKRVMQQQEIQKMLQ